MCPVQGPLPHRLTVARVRKNIIKPIPRGFSTALQTRQPYQESLYVIMEGITNLVSENDTHTAKYMAIFSQMHLSREEEIDADS